MNLSTASPTQPLPRPGQPQHHRARNRSIEKGTNHVTRRETDNRSAQVTYRACRRGLATGPRGLAALGDAALSTGLLTATTAPTAGGRDKSPGSHRSRWPDRLYTEPAWDGAAHVV